MALSSQVTRAGLNRRYMGSAPRRGRRWPWVLLVVALAGVLFAIQWLSDAEPPTTPIASSSAQPASAGVSTAGDSAPAASDAAPAPVAAVPAASTVPSITLGAQPAAAIGPSLVTPATTAAPPSPATPAPDSAAPAERAAATASSFAPDAASQADVAAVLRQGMELIADHRLVEGRRLLSDLLVNHNQRLAPVDAQAIRDTLASVNRELVFSRKIVAGDPAVEVYRVQPGDTLSGIGHTYHTPYAFLEMINAIQARRLQAGQSIKVIKGPFHARVDKSDYRMDIFLRPAGESDIYVCSFPVGLGESDSTPLGTWLVEEGKKVRNPAWVNPRTNQRYGRDDPDNPIGDYWIALKGLDPGMELFQGYGIHGTIDPESVGQQRSMGCVRLRDADIEQVFKMFQDGLTTVQIVP